MPNISATNIVAHSIATRLEKCGILTPDIEERMRQAGFWPDGMTREELGYESAMNILAVEDHDANEDCPDTNGTSEPSPFATWF